MAGIAHADEKILRKMFGIDSEILFDHAWGREPTTIADIKNYKSFSHSLSSGQVLLRDYNYEDALLIVKEMADLLCLDLVAKGLVTDNVSLYIGYSKDTISHTSGTASMSVTTNSTTIITRHLVEIYNRTTNPNFPIRRVSISANRVIDEAFEQYDFFTSPAVLERERKISRAIVEIKDKYGKDSIMKGMNLLEAGTTKERLHQIGGHKSGT